MTAPAACHPSHLQAVTETAAAKPTEAAAALNAAAKEEDDDADLDVDWIELAKQRQEEVMAQARALRETDGPLPTLPPPPVKTVQAPIGTPNPTRQRELLETSC